MSKNKQNDVSNDLNDIVRNHLKPGFYTKINVKTGVEINDLDNFEISEHPIFKDQKDGISQYFRKFYLITFSNFIIFL